MDSSDARRLGRSPFLAQTALLILALVAGGVAAAFVLPWFTSSKPGGALLARYSPLEHGGARLTVDYDAAGVVTRWTSQNEILLPPALAIASEMRKAERDAINKFFRRASEPAELPIAELVARVSRTQVYHARSRRLEADGTTSDTVLLAIRDGRADFLVAIYDPAKDAQTVFDPPLPALEANLTPGHSWEARGQRVNSQGQVDYHFTGRVVEEKRFENEAGAFDETLKIETRLVLSHENTTLYDGGSTYWIAPGLGTVESQSFDAAGKLESRSIIVSAVDRRLRVAALPPLGNYVAKPTPAGEVANWALSRFASTRSSTDNSESSVPATWIPTDPPMVLAARYGSGLVAFSAEEPGAPALWRFEPGGTIYGTPVYDPAGERIFFGAADKRFYALDPRGVFLWSFATGDNIVTQPVVAAGSVIFGSEDRHIYCLKAESGAEIWQRTLGGPVVSSPVLVNGVVIFGCDDGGVYAFDVTTGEERWHFAADEPIEAPIVSAAGRIFAATHGGHLFMIDPASGAEVWSAKTGGELRTAPAVADGVAYLVNGNSRLEAYNFATGRRRWSSEESDYIGPPVLVRDHLIVGSKEGDVHAVDLMGHRQKRWAAANASSPSDGISALRLGASAGGGAVWFADNKSVIRRLGPALTGAVALRASWLLPFSKEPFTQHFFTSAPAAYGEKALVVDDARDIFLLNPGTGKGVRVGNFGETGSIAIEPTVTGDTLLAISGTTLYATALPGGAARWKFDSKDSGIQPVAVAGDRVFWLTQHFPPEVNGKAQPPVGTLHALDLTTGAVCWQQSLANFTGIGAAVVHGSTVYTSAPLTAFDLTSGAPRWRVKLPQSSLGGGALNAAGDILFAGLIDEKTSIASMAAIRTADGSVAWQREIGSSSMQPLERPWLSGDILVVPLWSGEIIGLEAANGAERWRYKPVRPRYAISVADGRVWFAQNNSRVLALDATTGRVAAQLGLDLEIGNIQAFAPRPLILGDRVVVPLAMAVLGLRAPATPPEPSPPPAESVQP